jgi:antitoxin VapB
VRLPKEFRFEGSEVRIRRQGCRVVLEPVAAPAEDPWAWLGNVLGQWDEDAATAALEDVPQQERPELDEMFK